MSLLTYLDPNAIKDASIEGIKIKDGTISSSKIDETVASKNYVDTETSKCVKLSGDNWIKGSIRHSSGVEGGSGIESGGLLVADTNYLRFSSSFYLYQRTQKGVEDIHPYGLAFSSNFMDSENKDTTHPVPIYGIAVPTRDDSAANKEYVDTQVKTVDDKTVALEARTTNAVQITYSELKSLRDAGNLVPGTQYRITDYQCATSQPGTKSAGHQFDIIVTADDESTLNEEARAALHSGDEYFSGCNLNAWKIWYCLDNDTNRFAWADSANGKGVIYRMIDEFNNDVPYDFKNIQFKHPTNTTAYPYYYYTFANSNKENNEDCSLTLECLVYANKISPFDDEGRQNINRIIFIGANCFYNSFGPNCFYNVFLDNCYSNSFGHDSNYNSFGSECSNNSFGSECSYNSLGNGFQYNSFENSCRNNTFGDACWNNSFGSFFSSNTIGGRCRNSRFGTNCSDIKFASDSSASTIYSFYQNNHFGDGCKYIVLKGENTASVTQNVQNYNFAQGLQGTSSAYLTIDGVRNLSYETKVAKNSNGELKIYCEADLIL